MIKKYVLLLAGITLLNSLIYSQIISFEFNGLAGDEVSANSNFNDLNLSVSTIIRGSGLTPSINANRFNATTWALNDITTAVSGDNYMEFTINPDPGYAFDISTIEITLERSLTGTRGLALRSSLDSFTSDIDGEKAVADNTNAQSFSFSVGQSNLNSALTLRFYGWAEAAGGSGGFEGPGNDIIVNGSVYVSSTDQPDWCNIQFPHTPDTIQLGESYTVYARVNEPGITDSPGQGAGITAWIGYNTANNNPDGGAGWTWVPATWNLAVTGNNDEYQADLGTAIPATGTYYYASRFQLNNGPYIYGGSTGIWSNDSVELTVSPHILDWCNLQFPANGNISTGDTFDVFAQVYEPGVTDTPSSQGANIEAWIGYSSADTDPSEAGWAWILATYNPLCGAICGSPEINDEYYADIGTGLGAGTYYYASRFRIDNNVFYYGGYSGTGGGFWSSGVNVNGVLNVTDPAGSSCLEDGFDTIDGWTTHAEGNWTQVTPNGIFTGNGIYVNANDAIAGYKLGFNDNDDWVELPPVDNPLLFTYRGRLSSAPSGTNSMKVQVFNGGVWNDVVEHTATSTSYVQYSANLGAYSGNTGVRIRLLRTEDDISMYIDDIEVICADCSPTHTVVGFSPDNGPENTLVTITGTGFTTLSTVRFNGAAATIEYQSATELTVTVPAGASTGVITVTEAMCDVTSSSNFTLITSEDNGCEGGVSASDLFISEITDSTYGSMTYVEIYNGTGVAVNLADYALEIAYNGNSNNTDIATLSGTIANGDVHVVRTSTAGFVCTTPGGDGSYADQVANGLSGIDSAKNESDCITLFRNTSAVDVWGDCADKNWRENLGAAIGNEGFNFRRLTSASFPGTAFSLADWNILDWSDGSSSSTCNENDYSNIGAYASGFPPTITVQPSASGICDLNLELTVSAIEGYIGSNGLAYQWFSHAPGDSDWNLLTDGVDFYGSTTASLGINSLQDYIDYQFYCQVRENDGNCFSATVATRPNPPRTTWNGSGWDSGVPDISTIAIIDGNFDTITGGAQDSFSACSLIINASNTVVIRNGDYIEVDKDILVRGSTADNPNIVELTLEPGAAIVQNGDGGAAGTFTLESGARVRVIKQTAPLDNWYEYTYWSSPVSGVTVESAFPDTPSDRIYRFVAQNFSDNCSEINNTNTCTPGVKDDIDDAPPYDWQNFPSGVMETGRGYAATYSLFAPYPNILGTATFEAAAFNTGDIDVIIQRDDAVTDDNNWNLVGNPYPSAISAQAFLTENTAAIDGNPGGAIQGAIFLWSHNTAPNADASGNEVENFSQSDYAVINGVSGTAGGDGVQPQGYIPSGQGFFIAYDQSASGPTNTIRFKNSMRDNGNNNQFFQAPDNDIVVADDNAQSSISDKNRLWIDLHSDNGVFNQVSVAYSDGATDGYDGWYYDAPKNLSTGAHAILYSIIPDQEQKFAIQGKSIQSLTPDETIPLGFYNSISAPTLFSLSLNNFEGSFLSEERIYLKDHYSTIIHDLKSSDYCFTSDPGEFQDRFEIVFTDNSLSLDDEQYTVGGITVHEDQNGDLQVHIRSSSSVKILEISDMLGRRFFSINHPGTGLFRIDGSRLSQSTYIVRAMLADGRQLVKKAVKRL